MINYNIHSFDSQIIRNINEQIILNLVKEHDVIASTDLVKMTGMRPSTVFNILKHLQSQSLVIFEGKGASTDKGGKPPHLWRLNNNAAFIIGLDVEVEELSAVIINLGGEIVYQKRKVVHKPVSEDDLVTNIANIVEEVIKESKINKDKFLGLGIAIAGIVDVDNGIIIMSSLLPQLNINLLDKLKERISFPITLENNANAAAIGSKWIGQAKGKKNFMIVLVELDKHVSGLGIGLVINGELYHGASYCSGELYPHLPTLTELLYSFRTRLCESEILAKYANDIDQIDISIMIDAAKAQDKIAKQIFSVMGSYIGKTIAKSIALINPDTLIIAGDVSDLDDIIIKPISEVISTEVLSQTSNALTIVTNKHGHHTVSLGAGALMLNEYFKIKSLNKIKLN